MINSTFQKAEVLVSHIKEYANAQIDGVKLDVAEKSSKIISNIIEKMIVSLLFLLCIIFISIAVALIISKWLHTDYSGFLIVGLFYFIVGVMVAAFKEKLLQIPIMNSILNLLFNNKTNEKD